jgi:RimJ/RimL family protein N-acetyltransferase
MPVLETQRLALREFQFEDLDALATILTDRETMRYYPMSFDRRPPSRVGSSATALATQMTAMDFGP